MYENKSSSGTHLALLAYMMAAHGLSLMASVKRSKAFCNSPAFDNNRVNVTETCNGEMSAQAQWMGEQLTLS